MLIEQDANLVEETVVEVPLLEETVTEAQSVEVAISEDTADLEVEPVTEVEPAAVVESKPEEEQSKPVPKSKKRRKRPSHQEIAEVVSWFAACGRCSYFFAGSKVIIGEDEMESIIAKRGKHWLTMPWNHEMAFLIHKSYGSQVDTGCYHFEGCCSECRRQFVIQSADENGRAAMVRIELKTRARV